MKTRFCPSPTGHIHLGNARTALFSALIALHEQGFFLLRIEDTDSTRSTRELAQDCQQDLHWLGLKWNEGPEVGGENGPYWQSERQAIYDHYYEKLLEKRYAYPCFCSEQQLAMARKAQRSAGKPPRYPGTCRSLSAEEVEAKLAAGLKPTLRFRMPNDGVIEFNDKVKGLQRFLPNDIGDFVIRRADGTATFMYCNAIDDALMKVTLVLRGEDHLTNTPRQLEILRALELPQPDYAHMALIAGDDGSPLSKRHGSQSLRQLREAGYLPEALNNYLARVGHSYEENELFDLTTLAAKFDIEKFGKSAARFDKAQLLYWQKLAVAQLTEEQFWQWSGKQVSDQVKENRCLFFQTLHTNVTFPDEVMMWVSSLHAQTLDYHDDVLLILQQAGAEFFQAALEAVNNEEIDFTTMANHVKNKLKVKGKQLFQPLRLVLTGQWHGPEMKNIVQLLGPERMVNRFQHVLQLLTGESC